MSCAYVDPDPECPYCGETMVAEVDDVDLETGHAFWSWVCPNDECEGEEE